MATTSSNSTAGMAASGGKESNGTGHPRRAAGLVATAALGLALLSGLALDQVRAAAPPAAALAVVNPWDDVGPCIPTYRESHGLDINPAHVASCLPRLPTYRESHGLD